MPSLKEKDVPFVVLHQMAKYHPNWTICEARNFYEYRLQTWREAEVVHAITRAAYMWAEGIPEEILEEMLEEYRRAAMRAAA